MNIIKALKHFWRKPEPKAVQQSTVGEDKESVDLSMLENRFVIHAGHKALRCDGCKHETRHCAKLYVADKQVCVCPKEDLRRPFRRVGSQKKR